MSTEGERTAKLEKDIEYIKDSIEDLRNDLKSYLNSFKSLRERQDTLDNKIAEYGIIFRAEQKTLEKVERQTKKNTEYRQQLSVERKILVSVASFLGISNLGGVIFFIIFITKTVE